MDALRHILERILSPAELFSAEIVFAMTVCSALMIVASILILPLVLSRLPQDYFNHEKPHLVTRIRAATPLKGVTLICKNLLGTLLLFAGFLMLFLPGQGVLTILIGLILIDFPGKYRIERRIASNAKVLQAINWLRNRHGKPPMVISPPGADRGQPQ